MKGITTRSTEVASVQAFIQFLAEEICPIYEKYLLC